MKLYSDRLFPYLMKKNTGKFEILEHRRHLLKNAKGNILEIEIGAGTKLAVYPKEISSITAVDPSVIKLPESCIEITFKAAVYPRLLTGYLYEGIAEKSGQVV